MNQLMRFLTGSLALSAMVTLNGAAKADTLITTFDENYFENALYASWTTASIEYGPDSYSVTATGYGSNWTYIGDPRIMGAGNTHIKLDVTLEGPPEADGLLGPIVTLVDADGTRNNYAWFGQLLGNHILTLPLTSPTWVEAAGTTPGLDLDMIDHMHLQLDPSSYTSGPYTVRWNEVSLITVAGVPGDFDGDSDVDGRDFLVWQRGGSPTSLSAGDLSDWQNGYGTNPLASINAVPEPTTAGLLVLASVSVLGLRRPRKTLV